MARRVGFRVRDVVFITVAAVVSFAMYRPGVLYNLTNFTFVLGSIYLIIGLAAVVRNLGMFYSFSYASYKRKFYKYGKADHSARPLTFGEFVMEKKNVKTEVKEYFVVGIPIFAVSVILAFIYPLL